MKNKHTIEIYLTDLQELCYCECKAHNETIDYFRDVELRQKYGDEITIDQWFDAQKIIKNREYRDKGYKILKKWKNFGIDVKIRFDNKLVMYIDNVNIID